MPKIKTPPQAAAASSLEDCVVCFARYQPSGHPDFKGKLITAIKGEIDAAGGRYTTKVSDCTHLIITQKQFDESSEKNNEKVKEAEKYPNVQVVTYDWIAASLQASDPLDASEFLAGSTIVDNGDDEPTPAKPPRKRSRQDDDEGAIASPVKKVKSTSASFSASAAPAPPPILGNGKPAKIPVDEAVPQAHLYQVYVDGSGLIWDALLNQANSGENANKFYRIQLLHANGRFQTWTRWGRVGVANGQTKMLFQDYTLPEAKENFEIKFKDKTGNTWSNRDGPSKKGKYTYLEPNYEDSDDDATSPNGGTNGVDDKDVDQDDNGPVFAQSKLMPAVQNLMKLIFSSEHINSAMADLEYDANKLPLGKLSKKTLLKGYEVLKDLANIINDPSVATSMGETPFEAIADRSNLYFSLVPHVTGRSKIPVLGDMNLIRHEIKLLEALTDMQLANEIMKSAKIQQQKDVHILDARYAGLGMKEMTPLTIKSQEFKEIDNYLNKSVGGTHGVRYKIDDIFRIERHGEADRLEASEYARLGNRSDRRLLWHGSRVANFGGILSQGLRIAPPEAPASGYMFGKGVYLADMSSKSAGYCSSYSSGGTGILLLCEAELGTPALELTDADYNAGDRVKDGGHYSTRGQGQTGPSMWKDAKCVHDNLRGVRMPDFNKVAAGSTNVPGAYLMYNEYIVYDIAQIRLRYLLRVTMN